MERNVVKPYDDERFHTTCAQQREFLYVYWKKNQILHFETTYVCT